MRSETAYFITTLDEIFELIGTGWRYMALEKVIGEKLLVRMRRP